MKIDLDNPWTDGFSQIVDKIDIYFFFRHILGRLPSEIEWPGHCGFIGKNLKDVVSVYLNSPEFKSRKLIAYDASHLCKVDLGEGYKIFVSERDHGVGSHILHSGTYEPIITELFKKYLKHGMNVIDVGANIGWFSLLSAHLVGSKGLVYSFEPGTINGKILCINKQFNKFDNIKIIHAAASDKIESLDYSSSFSNGFVSQMTDVSNEEILSSDIVFGIPIDDVIPESLPVNLIKVDVEGYEMKVLSGALKIIKKWNPIIIAEFSEGAVSKKNGSSGNYLNLLIEAGYKISAVTKTDIIDCGQSIQDIINIFEKQKLDHIDILAMPITK